MRNRDCKTFTLIELLVVIAIIAILASMLLPALKRAKDNVYRVDCLSRMRQVGVGFQGYLNDFNGYYVPWEWDGVANTTMNWAYCLKTNDYVIEPKLYKCPAATMLTSIYTAGPEDVVAMPDSASRYLYIAIGYNSDRGFGRIDYQNEGRTIPVRSNQVKRPSQKFLLGDSNSTVSNQDHGINAINGIDPTTQNGTLHDRHTGMSNLVFADGHGESMENASNTSWVGNNFYIYWRYNTRERFDY